MRRTTHERNLLALLLALLLTLLDQRIWPGLDNGRECLAQVLHIERAERVFSRSARLGSPGRRQLSGWGYNKGRASGKPEHGLYLSRYTLTR